MMMSTVDDDLEQKTGRLVALEGDTKSLSLQLSLLPPSRKILVLPPISQELSRESSEEFDARSFIRDTHVAFTKRVEIAQSFLQSSTAQHPRLAFLNGGAISARATCIAKISENLTNGAIGAAETIFNEIVKDGVAGLMNHSGSGKEDAGTIAADTEQDSKDLGLPATDAVNTEDHLDSRNRIIQTENLENTSQSLYGVGVAKSRTSVIAHRSGSDPGIQKTWQIEASRERGSTPMNTQKAGFTTQEGDQIIRTVIEVPTRNLVPSIQDPQLVQDKRSTFGLRSGSYTGTTQFTNALTHQLEESEDEGKYDENGFTTSGDDIVSMPVTPAVVFGEACLVDVQSASPPRTIRKVQSFDRIYLNKSIGEDFGLTPPELKHTASTYQLHGRNYSSAGYMEKQYATFPTLLRTTFMKASETTIKRSPTLSGSRRANSTSSVELPVPGLYADRATDPGAFESLTVEAFTPIFPVTEDLIIHLVGESRDDILESVIQFCKSSNHPITLSPLGMPIATPDSPTSVYSSLTPMQFDGKRTIRPNSYQAMLQDEAVFEKIKESRLDPPTPALTPQMSSHVFPTQRFVDLALDSSSNDISIQNSLRKLLGVHFPAGKNGYTQHYYPASPEADRLWKPVFQNDQDDSLETESLNVDQIIALGCEEGVNKEFFSQISGQIERLGTKKDGVSRSGKLDIGYLIANATQTYSMSGLTTSESFEPLEPQDLACHIVPEIEAYLASNPSTRLLILHYQSSHLPIVLALRKILGIDLFKVTGILNLLSSDPPPIAHFRSPTKNPLSNESVADRWEEHLRHMRLHSLQPSKTTSSLDTRSWVVDSNKDSSTSFARANHLLPSTATDAEVTIFLTTIRKALMEKSTFYIPEPETKPTVIIRRPSMPPTPTPTSAAPSPFIPSEWDSSCPPSNALLNSPSKASRFAAASGSDARSISSRHRSPSRASTRRAHHESMSLPMTKSSSPNRGERRMTLADKEEKEWENFYIGEDDSDDDEFDRKIMGRQMARIVPEVWKMSEVDTQAPRNKKKALKWLGLA